jgi:hypothetical protein
VRAHQLLELERQPQLAEPHRGLVSREGRVRQFDVEQPVVDVRRPRAVAVEQELLLRRFPQDPVLDGKLGVRHRDLLDAGQFRVIERGAELAARVVPHDDAVLLELGLEAAGDAIKHGQRLRDPTFSI